MSRGAEREEGLLTQEERGDALRRIIEEHAPGEWVEERADPTGFRAGLALGPTISFVRSAERPYGTLTVEVVLRSDGDIDVTFRVPGHDPDLLEAHFLVATAPSLEPDATEPEAMEQVARFVGDFIAERLILGYDPSFLRGGRVFLPAADLDAARLRTLSWTVSWRGTQDHP